MFLTPTHHSLILTTPRVWSVSRIYLSSQPYLCSNNDWSRDCKHVNNDLRSCSGQRERHPHRDLCGCPSPFRLTETTHRSFIQYPLLERWSEYLVSTTLFTTNQYALLANLFIKPPDKTILQGICGSLECQQPNQPCDQRHHSHKSHVIYECHCWEIDRLFGKCVSLRVDCACR